MSLLGQDYVKEGLGEKKEMVKLVRPPCERRSLYLLALGQGEKAE